MVKMKYLVESANQTIEQCIINLKHVQKQTDNEALKLLLPLIIIPLQIINHLLSFLVVD